ncbi:hypothetical protein [Glaciecola sp. 1036]|uniref:hypothetical protein n=1 Tax=Alteromonadaceae TaxID=72275 RepID=UPI003CFDE887
MRYLLGFTLVIIATVSHAELRFAGSASVQQRFFFQDAAYEFQTNSQVSLAAKPQFELDVGDNGYFTFTPFARIDQRDSERTHADVREALYSVFFDNWEFRAGIGRVFWGQTESVHLVDIINQTDFVETITNEEKLGQPLLDARYLLDTGYISFYALPYFRERTFPGLDGRLRGPYNISDDALYESEDEETNLDFAVRWQQSFGNLEFGLSYFDGTDRLPDFVPQITDGDIELVPFYPQLQQVGLDALYVFNGWLFKLEALTGSRMDEDFSAAVAGFEFMHVNVFDSGYDLGYLVEYQYDERDQNPYIYGQNDIMVGARFVVNDFSGSEILVAFIQDMDESSSYSAMIEASTRLTSNWSIEVNGYFFSSDKEDDPLFYMRRDDHLMIQLEYFF